MFALSLVDFLSLLLSPNTDIKVFNFCQKYHLKDTYKIFKKLLSDHWSMQLTSPHLSGFVWYGGLKA